MDKELYIKAIEFIKKQNVAAETFLQALDLLSPGTFNDCFLYAEYENMLVDVLENATNDKNDYLGWWIYETEYGTTNTKIYDNDNNVIADIKTASDLYDYIEKEQKNGKKTD